MSSGGAAVPTARSMIRGSAPANATAARCTPRRPLRSRQRGEADTQDEARQASQDTLHGGVRASHQIAKAAETRAGGQDAGERRVGGHARRSRPRPCRAVKPIRSIVASRPALRRAHAQHRFAEAVQVLRATVKRAASRKVRAPSPQSATASSQTPTRRSHSARAPSRPRRSTRVALPRPCPCRWPCPSPRARPPVEDVVGDLERLAECQAIAQRAPPR